MLNLQFYQPAVNNNSLLKTYRKPLVNSNLIRNDIARVLFGNSLNSITFGWNQVRPGHKLELSAVQEKILDIITDPSNKTAIVTSHQMPDQDAYGSLIGVAGILKRLGMDVYPIKQKKEKKLFSCYNMPSAERGIRATDYIQFYNKTVNELNGKQLDIAVITDTSTPSRISSKVLQMLAEAKKIIIIDHHCDSNPDETNKTLWIKALKELLVPENNILYWQDSNSTSTSEMIGFLDKELKDESTARSIGKYKPNYFSNYRLALAAGIIADSSSILDKKGTIKLPRVSDNNIKNETEKEVNTTRYMLQWLIDNAEKKVSNKDLTYYSRLKLPEEIETTLDQIINKEITVPGIEIISHDANNPITCVIYHTKEYIEKLVEKANQTSEIKINCQDIMGEINNRLTEKLIMDDKIGLVAIVRSFTENETPVVLISYGDEYKNGDFASNTHINTEGKALKIFNILREKGLVVTGGGHPNVCGMALNLPKAPEIKEGSNKQSINGSKQDEKLKLNFKQDVLPIIREVLKT